MPGIVDIMLLMHLQGIRFWMKRFKAGEKPGLFRNVVLCPVKYYKHNKGIIL